MAVLEFLVSVLIAALFVLILLLAGLWRPARWSAADVLPSPPSDNIVVVTTREDPPVTDLLLPSPLIRRVAVVDDYSHHEPHHWPRRNYIEEPLYAFSSTSTAPASLRTSLLAHPHHHPSRFVQPSPFQSPGPAQSPSSAADPSATSAVREGVQNQSDADPDTGNGNVNIVFNNTGNGGGGGGGSNSADPSTWTKLYTDYLSRIQPAATTTTSSSSSTTASSSTGAGAGAGAAASGAAGTAADPTTTAAATAATAAADAPAAATTTGGVGGAPPTVARASCAGKYKEPNPFNQIETVADRLSFLEDLQHSQGDDATISTLLLLTLAQHQLNYSTDAADTNTLTSTLLTTPVTAARPLPTASATTITAL